MKTFPLRSLLVAAVLLLPAGHGQSQLPAADPAVEVSLQKLLEGNKKLIERQQAIEKRIEELEAVGQQIRIFAKRG